MKKIHFGTDGWRGIIGEDFIFDNIRRIAIALSTYIKNDQLKSNPVVIGYDNRFLSERSAKIIAEILSKNKFSVIISKSSIPTPTLSFAAKLYQSPVGIMITASHNPYYYNGIKFKLSYGGPAMPIFTSGVESKIPDNVSNSLFNSPSVTISEENFLLDYKSHIKKYVNFKILKKSKAKVVVDSMFGSGGTILRDLLKETSIKCISLRDTRDAFFGGGLPEPILNNLKSSSDFVKKEKFDLVIATDGDADRIGILNSKGEFVQLHYLMPILYEYLLKSRGWTGMAVRTTSTDNLFDEVVKEYGQQIIEVPVGFKNVCEQVLNNDILVGGEESGGIYVKKHIPERDGILIGLLVLEMIEETGRSIQDLVNDLIKRFWEIHYLRIDRYHDMTKLKNIMNSLRTNPPEKLGIDIIEKVSLIDGIKFYFKNGGWLLFRVSDTEPLGRIYTAACDKKMVKRLLTSAEKLIFGDNK